MIKKYVNLTFTQVYFLITEFTNKQLTKKASKRPDSAYFTGKLKNIEVTDSEHKAMFLVSAKIHSVGQSRMEEYDIIEICDHESSSGKYNWIIDLV